MEIEVKDGTLIAQIEIKRSPQKVFDALCHAELWWGAADMYHVQKTLCTFEVGSEYISEGTLADGSNFHVKGLVVAFDPPKVFAHTWNASWDPEAPETTVEYRLEPNVDGGTRLTLRHGSFDKHDRESAEHYRGWTLVLSWLQGHLESDRI